MKTDVIIPVRRELDTIEGVVNAFWRHSKIGEIFIVVNGEDHIATMDYRAALSRYDEDIWLLWSPTEGKGQAVRHALRQVTTREVIFCDGDLRGLQRKHVDILLRPYRGIVVGYPEMPERMPVPWPVPDQAWQLVSGERRVNTEWARQIDLHGYAMEAQMNEQARRDRIPIRFMKLTGVTGKIRENKVRMAELRRDREWLQNQGKKVPSSSEN